MPHKRNPITCERVSGLARVMRGYSIPALEDVALWHERDISHSSVERVILADATITLDYMLQIFTRVVDKLLVYPDTMRANLNKTGGLIYSQRVLLALVDKGAMRDDAYRWVQRNAMKRWLEGEDFLENLLKDEDIRRYLSTTIALTKRKNSSKARRKSARQKTVSAPATPIKSTASASALPISWIAMCSRKNYVGIWHRKTACSVISTMSKNLISIRCLKNIADMPTVCAPTCATRTTACMITSAKVKACSLKALRRLCSISTTAPIRSSRARTRSRAALASAPASVRTAWKIFSAW